MAEQEDRGGEGSPPPPPAEAGRQADEAEGG